MGRSDTLHYGKDGKKRKKKKKKIKGIGKNGNINVERYVGGVVY